MIRDLLTNVGGRTLIPSHKDSYKLPFTKDAASMSIADDLSYVIDLKRGSKLNLDAPAIKDKALGTHIDLENPKPLSAVYLSALAVKNPFLPDEILVDADKAPDIHISYFTDNNYSIKKSKYVNYIWIFPDGGIEHLVHAGYYYIPAFPDYCINNSGTVIRVSDGQVIDPDVLDNKLIPLRDGDGVMRTVPIKYLVILAFGKYDKTMSEDVYFLDGDETNFNSNNVFSELTETSDLSVTLTDTDENNVENY